MNAGTAAASLGRDFITPDGAFFVRSHGPVPTLDASGHRLTVEGLIERPLDLSLADLEARLEPVEVVATLECAGNRRAELSVVAPTPSPLQWGIDAIGTALWTGVRLRDVLGLARPTGDAFHVWFEGADEVRFDDEPTHFGGSVPLAKALGPETLLATRMNGRPLPWEHGGPVRALVPGYIGARSVKWLRRIMLAPNESRNPFQRFDYRYAPSVPGVETPPGAGEAVGALRLTSAITSLVDGERVRAGGLEVFGYALAERGDDIDRVELSLDDGASWLATELGGAGDFAWRLWHANVVLPVGEHRVVVRAWDRRGTTQPPDVASGWNSAGYMNRAWHRIRVRAG